MAINYNFYGSTVGQGFDDSNVFKINIAEFKESDWLPLDRWQDEYVRYITVKYSDDEITYSDIVTSIGNATNLISYPRCNILHRSPEFGYVYDGDYFTWLANSFGSQYMTLSMYAEDFNMYTIDMEQHLSNFSRDDIGAIYLVGYLPENGIPVIRPIIKVSNTRYIIAPILGVGLIDHWHMVKQDTEKPNGGEPSIIYPTDDYFADGWKNRFSIMRSPPYKDHITKLVDFNTQEEAFDNWDDMCFFSPEISLNVTGHLRNSIEAPIYYTLRNQQGERVNNVVKIGSSLQKYRKNGSEKTFVTGVESVDGSAGYLDLPLNNEKIVINRNNNTLKITYDNGDGFSESALEKIKIKTTVNGTTKTYTYNGTLGLMSEGGGTYLDLGLWVDTLFILCIPKGNGIPPDISGFYLLGRTACHFLDEGANHSAICNYLIIDKLDDLDLGDIFDDWDKEEITPEQFTEDLIEDELGGDLGTGELIDVESTDGINTHDGTMGNGTGSVHEGDTTIPDPENDLPIAGGEGSVLGSGFIKVYTPSKTQLDSFTSELLSDNVIDALKDYFTSNPMEGIIGLSMLPYTGFSSNTHGKPKIGTYKFNTELDTAGREYLTVDYGTIDVKFSYDGYENYSQYSDCKIFLPHIGYKEIDIDMVQGCRLHLKYLVSLVTGDIYAYLYAKWVSGKNKGVNNIDHLLYHWQGNCNMTVPVTHIDKSSYVNGAIQSVGNIASIVSGGLTMNSLAGQMTMAESSGEYASLNKQFEGTGLSVGRNISGLASNVASMFKPSVTTSGSISGACAYMSERTPYLLLSRPIITGTEDIKRHYGLVTCKKYKISELKNTGYTELNGVDLNGVSATEEELNELKSILEGGYYA